MRDRQGPGESGKVLVLASFRKEVKADSAAEAALREAAKSTVHVDVDWKGDMAVKPFVIQPAHALTLLSAFIELCGHLLDVYAGKH